MDRAGLVVAIFGAATVAALAIYFPARAGYRHLRRGIERDRRARALLAQPRPTTTNVEASSIVPLVVAVVEAMMILVLAGRKEYHGLILLSLPLLAVAFILHGLPHHNRSHKYMMLWLGLFIQSVALTEEYVARSLLWLSPAGLLCGTAICAIHRRRRPGALPGKAQFQIYRSIMAMGPGPGLIALLMLTVMRAFQLFPGYLVFRYFYRPYVGRRPFLYLRSFRDEAARRFFGDVLARSVGTNGVVVGLIHEQQTGEDLHRETSRAWLAEVVALPDSAWQPWVSGELERCAGAVIDVSVPTPSVRWELQEALRSLSPRRILLVSHNPISNELRSLGARIVTYGRQAKSNQRVLRAAVLEWSTQVVQQFD